MPEKESRNIKRWLAFMTFSFLNSIIIHFMFLQMTSKITSDIGPKFK